MRTCWLSLRAAEALGLDAATRSCLYHAALNATMAPMFMAGTGEGMRYFLRHLAAFRCTAG